MNYKTLEPHLRHIVTLTESNGYIDLACSCGEILTKVPRYIGADVLCVGIENEEDRLNVYVSFGEYEPDREKDSFGIPDSRIYEYLTYEEFIDAVKSEDGMLDEYYHIINYELVENDRELETQ